MIDRPHAAEEEDEKMEIDASDIADDFAELDTGLRKLLWIILKSITDETHRVKLTEWLNSQKGQPYKDYYQTIQTKIGRFFLGEVLASVKELLKPIDSIVQMSNAQIRNLCMVEPRLYEFFGKNPHLYHAIVLEVNDEVGLAQFIGEFKDFLIAKEIQTLVDVETYFVNLDVDVRDTLWLALNSPFDEDSQKLAYDWLNEGFGRHYFDAVAAFDAKLKIFLEGKLDEYLEVLMHLEDKSKNAPEEKLYKFFADNLPLFEFIRSELDKENSVIMKVLREYKRFLAVPVYRQDRTLKAYYDKTHPRKTVTDDKNALHIRQLGIFAKAPVNQPTIKVCSLSLDNCLFNSDYYKNYRSNRATAIIDYNTEFFTQFAADTHDQFKQIIIMNGSLRQSYPADEFYTVIKHPTEASMLMSEPCFTAMPAIANHITMLIDTICTLDEYLLVDTFSNLEEGQTFRAGAKKAADEKYATKELENICVNDKSKIVLLYAQMHRNAVRFKNELIQFDFYSGDFQELQKIFLFFVNNRVLKPLNVVLNLFLYAQKSVEKKFQVDNYQGGTIDFDYKINLKVLVQACNLPNRSERPLSPTDDKRMGPTIKFATTSRINAVMPATKTLMVNEKFNAAVFGQMREYKETINQAQCVLKTTPMTLSALR